MFFSCLAIFYCILDHYVNHIFNDFLTFLGGLPRIPTRGFLEFTNKKYSKFTLFSLKICNFYTRVVFLSARKYSFLSVFYVLAECR